MYTLRKFSLILLVSAAVFGSCATGSKAYNTGLDQLDEFAPLAPGASAYLYIDVSGARPLLETVPLPGVQDVNKKDMAQILDRTNSAVAAYYPETAPRRFLAAAKGKYPSARANMSFSFSSRWKKRKSAIGDSYWYSARDKLAVSLSGNRAFVSDGDPFVPSPGTVSPEGFPEFRRGAVLAGWVDDAAPRINQFLETLGLPIEIPAGQTLFTLYRKEDLYEGKLRLETPSPAQAKGLAAIIGFARLFLPRTDALDLEEPDQMSLAGILFANPAEADGKYLTLHTGAMSEKGIALLFALFSVYSN